MAIVSARIDKQEDGTYTILNDDTEECMGTEFPTRGAAEQFALDHDCNIVAHFNNEE